MSTDTTPGPRSPKKAPPGGPAKARIKSTPIKTASVPPTAPIKTVSVPPATPVKRASVPPAPATIKTASAPQSAKATKVARKRPAEVTAPIVDPEYRRALIAEEAYLRAERRHFASGYEVEDWLNAESDIDTRLTLGLVPPKK
jgi:hypothetical protein